MKDTKITKAIINERRELSVNILVKAGDYTEIEAELLRQSKISGDAVSWTLGGLLKADDESEIRSARQALALTMQDYANTFHYKLGEVEQRLYDKYKIKSRTDLSLVELQFERESYRTAIISGQP